MGGCDIVSGMSLEERITELHSGVFFREFSFSRNNFYPTPATQKEFADQVVYYGEDLLVYQLKERETGSIVGESSESNWFKNVILKKGVNQIYDTLTFLREHSSIQLTNQKGHAFNMVDLSASGIHKVILFRHPQPEFLVARQQYKISQRAGFVHILSEKEYEEICHWLYTPKEIATYLSFRETALPRATSSVEENALLGQFLLNALDDAPNESFARGLTSLVDDRETYDIRDIIYKYRERVENLPDEADASYYPILFELAKLKRNDLRCFKERYSVCAAAAMSDQYIKPTRFYNSKIGFVFAVTPQVPGGPTTKQRLTALENFTHAAKFLSRLDKQIGLIFQRSGSDCLIDWMYLKEPWCHDSGIARALETNNPFREVREEMQYSYFHDLN